MHYSSRIKFSSKEKRERQRGETSESNLLTRINSRHTKSFRVEKLTTNDRVKKKKRKENTRQLYIFLSPSINPLRRRTIVKEKYLDSVAKSEGTRQFNGHAIRYRYIGEAQWRNDSSFHLNPPRHPNRNGT